MKIQVIPEEFIREHFSRQDAAAAVSAAFVAYAKGEALNFDVARGRGKIDGTVVNVKSGMSFENGLVCVKAGTFWPQNYGRGLPNHGSAMLVLDEVTGFPKAVINAAYLNGLRTAAADAVAVRHLAREDASILAVVGAGNQAEHDIRAIIQERPIEKIRLWSRSTDRSKLLCDRLEELSVSVEITDLETTVRSADIIVTATPSRTPLVEAEWIGPGAHISAMGADGPGKQELSPTLFAKARVFADAPGQAQIIGECQHPVAAGIITLEDVSPIGAVLDGGVSGRRSDDDVTLFDSSGIAVQDVYIADAVLSRAIDSTHDFSSSF